MTLGGVLLILAGAAIWFVARRGSRVGTHPSCVRCGFDLFGLPAEHARCPECGADIRHEGAVALGHRRPVFWAVCVGGAVIFCGVALAGAGLTTWWLHFDGVRWKTVGMLLGDLRSVDATREQAARELCRRADAGSLSQAGAARVANAILAWQADPGVAWDLRWGDVVETQRGDRLLPDALWNQYLAQAMQLSARARPRIDGMGVLPMEFACNLKRGGARDLAASMTPILKLSGDGKEKTFPLAAETAIVQNPQWGVAWEGADAPGKHTVHVELSVALEEHSGGRARAARSWDIAYEQLPWGQASVTLHAPTAAEQREMDAAIEWRLKTLADGNLLIQPRVRTHAGMLRIAGPPVAVAARIVLRQQGHEWPVFLGLVHANDGTSLVFDLPASDEGQGPQPGKAELVCLPDPSQAEMTADVTEIWGGEIHKAVVLERPDHDGP